MFLTDCFGHVPAFRSVVFARNTCVVFLVLLIENLQACHHNQAKTKLASESVTPREQSLNVQFL